MHAWYFSAADVLPNGDGRKIVIGETLTVEGKIIPCRRGLHASVSAFDALKYAPGPLLWRVDLGGTVVPHGDPADKYAASERTTLAGGVDVTPLLRGFARQCAFDVLHLWEAPATVREYLETGNEDLRDAAWAAARDVVWAAAAAWAAARDAAWDAAWAAAAAKNAARDAAWAAVAARDAAWNAAWASQRTRFDAWNAAWASQRTRFDAWDAAWASQRTRFDALCDQFVPLEAKEQ